MKLTQKQADVLAFIKVFIKEVEFSPNATDIAHHFDFYPNAAWCHIKALEKKGALTYERGQQRTIRPVKGFKVEVKV